MQQKEQRLNDWFFSNGMNEMKENEKKNKSLIFFALKKFEYKVIQLCIYSKNN